MATHSEPMDVEQITPASAVNSVELVVAARAGERRTLIRVLDEAGWDGVNQAMAMDMSCAGANLLHFIAEAGHDGVLLALLSRADAASGCAVDGKDLQGSTALHWAASEGQHECMRVLLNHGASTEIIDMSGETPLHWAALAGYREACELLLKHGANSNATSDEGKTALHLASTNRHIEVVCLLIDAGADPDIKDKEGMSARAIAREAKDDELMLCFDPIRRQHYKTITTLKKEVTDLRERLELMMNARALAEEQLEASKRENEKLRAELAGASEEAEGKAQQIPSEQLELIQSELCDAQSERNGAVDALEQERSKVKAMENELAELRGEVQALRAADVSRRAELDAYKKQAAQLQAAALGGGSKDHKSAADHEAEEGLRDFRRSALMQLRETFKNASTLLSLTTGSLQDTSRQLGLVLDHLDSEAAPGATATVAAEEQGSSLAIANRGNGDSNGTDAAISDSMPAEDCSIGGRDPGQTAVGDSSGAGSAETNAKPPHE